MTAIFDAVLALPPWVVVIVVFALPAVEASLFVGLLVPARRPSCWAASSLTPADCRCGS